MLGDKNSIYAFKPSYCYTIRSKPTFSLNVLSNTLTYVFTHFPYIHTIQHIRGAVGKQVHSNGNRITGWATQRRQRERDQRPTRRPPSPLPTSSSSSSSSSQPSTRKPIHIYRRRNNSFLLIANIVASSRTVSSFLHANTNTSS